MLKSAVGASVAGVVTAANLDNYWIVTLLCLFLWWLWMQMTPNDTSAICFELSGLPAISRMDLSSTPFFIKHRTFICIAFQQHEIHKIFKFRYLPSLLCFLLAHRILTPYMFTLWFSNMWMYSLYLIDKFMFQYIDTYIINFTFVLSGQQWVV